MDEIPVEEGVTAMKKVTDGPKSKKEARRDAGEMGDKSLGNEGDDDDDEIRARRSLPSSLIPSLTSP